MRILLATLVTIAATSPTHATDQELADNPGMQQIIRRNIEHWGLNCPVPLRIIDQPDDYRGQISKIDCATKGGSNSWSIRRINLDYRSRYEPW